MTYKLNNYAKSSGQLVTTKTQHIKDISFYADFDKCWPSIIIDITIIIIVNKSVRQIQKTFSRFANFLIYGPRYRIIYNFNGSSSSDPHPFGLCSRECGLSIYVHTDNTHTHTHSRDYMCVSAQFRNRYSSERKAIKRWLLNCVCVHFGAK